MWIARRGVPLDCGMAPDPLFRLEEFMEYFVPIVVLEVFYPNREGHITMVR
jgi:hypothetical protein